MRPCILATAWHSRQDSLNDRREKDTKGILCIFVKDDDDNKDDDISSCYALKPSVESVDADPACLMRITYGDESGIWGHAERTYVPAKSRVSLSVSLASCIIYVFIFI